MNSSFAKIEAMPRLGRECGDCRLCCRVMSVSMDGSKIERVNPDGTVEFPPGADVKPAGEWCRHVGAKGEPGCGIYATRPEACSGFRCVWLDSPTMHPVKHRPDKLGGVFVITDTNEAIAFFESYQGAAERPEAASLIGAMASQGIPVFVIAPGELLSRVQHVTVGGRVVENRRPAGFPVPTADGRVLNASSEPSSGVSASSVEVPRGTSDAGARDLSAAVGRTTPVWGGVP